MGLRRNTVNLILCHPQLPGELDYSRLFGFSEIAVGERNVDHVFDIPNLVGVASHGLCLELVLACESYGVLYFLLLSGHISDNGGKSGFLGGRKLSIRSHDVDDVRQILGKIA